MANGLPIIASNFASIAQIVNEVRCGLLVDPLADRSGIVKTIVMWWYNKSVPQELGENGRRAVLLKYYWENQANSLVNLYQELA
jgi:glycosyltransferase involved in cell wall biosynthesis